MLKTVAWISLGLMALVGCYQDELILLEELKEEKTIMEQKISELEGRVAQAEPAKSQLAFLADKLKGVKAKIVTNFGDIELAFFPQKAPIHCFNFITRAESGFYDNTKFHRVMKGFMIQGGDPNSKDNNPYNDGAGGPIVAIPHEFNSTPHKPGILSMARVGNKSLGAGCQFFIMHGDSPQLNNEYTAFGQVTQGMEVVNKIAEVQTHKQDRRRQNQPVKPVVIRRIEVYR